MTPSTDYPIIKSIVTDSEINYFLTDDFSPEDFELPEALTYLVSEDEDAVCLLLPRNGVEVEVHVAVLKKARHRAYYYAKRGLDWIFSNTQFLKVTAMVPFFNKQTYRFCKKLGYSDEGINRMSFMKDGILQDQWLLGLTREDWICRF